MSEPRTVAEGERRVLATVTRLRAAAHRRVFRGSGSVDELHLNPRVQHIGSHPHSPGRCGRRPFMFTRLRTSQMSMRAPPLVNRPYDAILDVFLALPPMPAELHALRLRLAFSGRLFLGNPFS